VFRLFLDYLYYDQIDFDEFRNIDTLADIDDLFGLWKISMLYDIPYLGKIYIYILSLTFRVIIIDSYFLY
jgi:hypothetical protein